MYFINYAFLCLFVGIYLYFQLTNTQMPEYWTLGRVWISWGFLLWGGFLSGRVIVDCLLLSAKGEMSTGNVMNGILLAVLNFLPVLGMSVFMLKEGFAGK